MASEKDRLRSAACGHGLRLAEQVRDGLASREALCGLAELIRLDPAIDPAVEDLDHSWPGSKPSARTDPTASAAMCARVSINDLN